MDELVDKLRNLNDQKLIDVVKNHQQYGYDDTIRNTAISILEERGISKEQLRMTGNFQNSTYDYMLSSYQAYRKNSKVAFVLYFLVIFALALEPMASPNSDMPFIVTVSLFLLFFIFLIKSFNNQRNFYKAIGEEYGAEGAIIYLFIGMPLYIIMYFFFRRQMKEKMREGR